MSNTRETWVVTSGDWAAATNWDGDIVPDSNTDASIAASVGGDTITTETGPASSASLSLAGPITLDGQFDTSAITLVNDNTNLTIESGGDLNDSGALIGAYQSSITVLNASLEISTLTGSFLSETLNGGSITVGNIEASPLYNTSNNNYTVVAGVFTVLGSISRGVGAAGDSFDISGSVNGGQFIVDGAVYLGNDQVDAHSGGIIEFANIDTSPNEGDTFSVDSSSSIEIGSGGGPAAGAFTIDAGQTLRDGGSITAPIIVDNGIIEVGPGESLSLGGSGTGLTGTGSVLIDSDAALTIQTVGKQSQVSIAFAANGGVLNFSHASLNSTFALVTPIEGFGPTDRLVYQGDITDVSFSGDTLTLLNGSATVATLTLTMPPSGVDYATASFFANYANGTTQIVMSTGGDTATVPTGTSTADQYVWSPNVAGSWDNPANWIDTTSGASPAMVAPGQNDSVAITAASGTTDVVTGTGNSASLTLSNVDIKGQLSTQALSIQTSYETSTIDVGASLNVDGDFNDTSYFGSLIVDGSFNVTGDFNDTGSYDYLTVDGTLNVAGNVIVGFGSELTLNSGAITLGGLETNYSNYNVNGGVYTVTGSVVGETAGGLDASFRVSGTGRIVVDGNTSLAEGDNFDANGSGSIELSSETSAADNSDAFNVQGAASIEIGTLGEAGTAPTAGSFTLDAGQTLTDGGSITAPQIVIDGTLEVGDNEALTVDGGVSTYNPASGDYVYSGGLTGNGTLQLDNNAQLTINGFVESGVADTIVFTGTGGVLSLSPSTLTGTGGAFLPTIEGFGPTDRLIYQGDVTDASLSGDTLTLLNGGATVATLTLTMPPAGVTYAGATFSANYINGTTQIVMLRGGDTATPPPGTATADDYNWNTLAGSWDNPANWIDTTSGASPAMVAPGQNDSVAITAASGTTDVVTGTGNSASLTLSNVDIKGQLSTQALSIQTSYETSTIDVGASLNVDGDFNDTSYFGSLIVDGSFNVTGDFNDTGSYDYLTVDGTLNVAGNVIVGFGSELTLNSGAITLGGLETNYSNYNVNGGVYTVTGSVVGETAGGLDASFRVSGTGRIVVDGNTSLAEGDNFDANGSGSIELSSETSAADNSDAFNVQGAASIEIGTLGEAGTAPTAGSFTLDAGQTLTDGGSITAPQIIIDGTLEVGDNEALTVDGGVSTYNPASGDYVYSGGLTGNGTLQLDNNAQLTINGFVESGVADTIVFTGTGGVLSLSPSTLTGTGGAFLPTIEGFGPTDRLVYQGDVTDVSFSGDTLTLLNGSATVATLTLTTPPSGVDYAAASFFADYSNGTTQIVMSTGGDTATVPTGTSTADQYVWSPNVAGSWDNPANWIDTTSGASPAMVAPGQNDSVAITAASGTTDVVTGTGNSASLTLSNVDIKGQLSTQALSIQTSYETSTIDVGASLNVDGDFNDTSYFGSLIVDGSFNVTGDFNDTGSYDYLTVDGTLNVAGNVIVGFGSELTLNSGAITLGGLETNYSNYNVNGGVYTVTGSVVGETAGGLDASFRVSGTGRIVVDGNTSLAEGDNFDANGSGSIELSSETSAADNSDAFNVQGAASIEIGTLGEAGTAPTAGSFTLDAGQTLTDGGSITAPQIIIDGTLEVGDNEALTVDGGVSTYNPASGDYVYSGGLTGNGTLQLDNNAQLTINGFVESGVADTIVFTGTGGVLSLSPSTLTGTGGAFLPTIEGFGPTDRLIYQGDVTDASFSGDTLTLLDGSATVATLTLTMPPTGVDYAAVSFFANYINGSTQIVMSTGVDTATAPPGTATADQYVWSPNVAGSWDNPANWVDITSGASPANVAPGQNDLVAITAASGTTDVVTGTGNSASLTLSRVDIKGQLSTQALSIQSSYDSSTIDVGASLSVDGDFNDTSYLGSLIVDGSLNVTGNLVGSYGNGLTLNSGSITLSGLKTVYNTYNVYGGVFTVTGSVVAEDPRGSLASFNVYGNGKVVVDGNTPLGADFFGASGSGLIELAQASGLAGSYDNFYVHDAASIEIGTLGEAGTAPIAGSFTLDAGRTLTDGGSITAPQIVINGTLEVGDNQSLSLSGGTQSYNPAIGNYVYSGGLTGNGTVQIDNNAQLTINGSVDPAAADTIVFAGTGGTLSLAPSTLTASGGAFLPTISGFSPGDTIIYQGAVSDLSFDDNTLTLLNGSATVATLTLTLPAGSSYSGSTFYLTNNGGTASITVASGGDAAPTINAPTMGSFTPNMTTPVSGVTIFDATVVPTVTVTVTDTYGILTANDGIPAGGGTVTGSGSNSLTITGSLAEANADLTTLSYDQVTSFSDIIGISVSNGLGGVTTASIPESMTACYCPGTRILTDHGEVSVEALEIGDRVITESGASEPIRWIGRRSYDGRFIAGDHLMLPVCIRAGALANNIPHTDLHVSPGHGMFVDGQIVPAWRLINGVTITQAKAVKEVTYFHVELHRHAMLLANGAPAESFLDETGFRNQFVNAAEFYALYDQAALIEAMQMRLEDGFALQRIQDRLAERAGLFPSIEVIGALRGFVDVATPERVCGWAQDLDSPEAPVELEVLLGGQPLLCLLANAYRADLRRANMGSGCHAFDFALPAGVSGAVMVRRIADGAVLRATDVAATSEQRAAA